MSIIIYLKNNLIKGLLTPPTNLSIQSLLFLIIYATIAIVIGFNSGLLSYSPLDSNLYYYIPFILFIFPSIIEEVFFRGILIPIDTKDKSKPTILFRIFLSSSIYTLWHPFVAILNPISGKFFNDLNFLFIVFILGLTCGSYYIYSKSLWVPILIHWTTVLVWVMFLGGRNLVLD